MSNEKSRQTIKRMRRGGNNDWKWSNVEGCKTEQWQIVNEKEGVGRDI